MYSNSLNSMLNFRHFPPDISATFFFYRKYLLSPGGDWSTLLTSSSHTCCWLLIFYYLETDHCDIFVFSQTVHYVILLSHVLIPSWNNIQEFFRHPFWITSRSWIISLWKRNIKSRQSFYAAHCRKQIICKFFTKKNKFNWINLFSIM